MNWVQIIIIIISGAVLFSLLVALIKGIYLSVRNVTRIFILNGIKLCLKFIILIILELDVHTVERRNSIDV
ncbi:MAG TPA: hypothetical protein GXZ51_04605 [Acholeplasma sp.]|nr:hypothetical protein [Acholeplasma sp.]